MLCMSRTRMHLELLEVLPNQARTKLGDDFEQWEALFVSSEDTPCSFPTINRGRGLKDDSRFANDVRRVGGSRKEIASRQNPLERITEAKKIMMEEKTLEWCTNERVRKKPKELKED